MALCSRNKFPRLSAFNINAKEKSLDQHVLPITKRDSFRRCRSQRPSAVRSGRPPPPHRGADCSINAILCNSIQILGCSACPVGAFRASTALPSGWQPFRRTRRPSPSFFPLAGPWTRDPSTTARFKTKFAKAHASRMEQENCSGQTKMAQATF